MSEKDQQHQTVDAGEGRDGAAGTRAAQKEKSKSKEERLAEALRANLRRRKSAAKSRNES